MNWDFTKEREAMVEKQLVSRGITDPAVLTAMKTVPRERFMNSTSQFMAYNDFPLPIGKGQTMSQPYMVALMCELLELTGVEKVLEIGAGSGYHTAVLCKLCRKVISIEKEKDFATKAQTTLQALGYSTKVLEGDGTEGYIYSAPYDAILVTAAAEKVPPPLLAQLKVDGRIVIPLGGRAKQTIVQLTKKMDNKGQVHYVEKRFVDCLFVPLKGKYGMK